MKDLASHVHDVPDFPKTGIVFRDITPLLLDKAALRRAVEALAAPFQDERIDCVAAIESRGFILGAPIAVALGCGFVPIRKLGKLPRPTISRNYALEYGSNQIEMHADAIRPNNRVLIVDDVLATGGTAMAALELVRESGGVPVAAAFLVEIKLLEGREKLDGTEVFSLLNY